MLRRQTRTIDLPAPEGGRLTTVSGVVEIDELAHLINELLDRRDAAVARKDNALEAARAFAATAAHELRTPLTSMSTNISLLAHPDLTDTDRAEIIADLGVENGRIHRLITMLRLLARGELLDPATFSAVDLTELVDVAVEDARRRHPHAAVATSMDEGVIVRGWAEGLRMIVDNLLDNAAIHGADDAGRATVEVTLSRTDDEAGLVVKDVGPGIPAGQRHLVFDRFHRRADSPGSGLGLTLAYQQAVLHGGTLTVGSPPGGPGTWVRLLLPYGAASGDTRSWLIAHRPDRVACTGLHIPPARR